MAKRLKERSRAHEIFVSPCANANELMAERDLTKNELLKQLVNGDTLKVKRKKNQPNEENCLVILGYAGLSTNCKDLEKFLRNNTVQTFARLHVAWRLSRRRIASFGFSIDVTQALYLALAFSANQRLLGPMDPQSCRGNKLLIIHAVW
ncbi:hypothetical protein DM01DRAFT_1303141 [Hesseltinella vesiculosa]|uniref:Uncharacterized protein n=1 Tax=Hesseltinella vesiculosa TaxID=101127 RepID=A0A1X2GN25_9FUNG|nr:hypothetical protein DM01DRAFT_1303141 [Hesseltinella vesiculosa]